MRHSTRGAVAARVQHVCCGAAASSLVHARDPQRSEELERLNPGINLDNLKPNFILRLPARK